MLSLSLYSHYNPELPFSKLFTLLLKSRQNPTTFQKSRQLHAFLLTSTLPTSSPFLFNNLISLYSKCSSLTNARQLFDQMPTRNLISYNTLISSFAKSPKHARLSFDLFRQLLLSDFKPSASTFASLAHASALLQDHFVGAALHCKVLVNGFFGNVCVRTSVLGMYANCGAVGDAERVVGELGEKDCVAWNCMISGCVKSGKFKKGIELFHSMVREGVMPSEFTFSIVLSACGRSGDLGVGRIIHAYAIKSDILVDNPLENALLDMYASCGDLDMAVLVFERIENPGLVSWNSLISAYSEAGEGEIAMGAFVQMKALFQFGMVKPDEYTYASIVSVTAILPYLFYGKPLHTQVIKTGLNDSTFVANTLLNMYFLNNDPGDATNLFKDIPEKDVVMWTEMIVGHSRLGEGEVAMNYFHSMLSEGHKVDSFSLSSALSSSADLTTLRQGEMLHSLVVKAGYEENMCVCGSLVDMYAKNGNLGGACSVFGRIKEPDLKCWNSMIAGYGNYGNAEEAFKLFSQMEKLGLEPDNVTYVSVLSACSHCRLVERGRFYWFCMMSDDLRPGLKHYTCIVSLLSRAGLLREAVEMIMESPFVNSPELWRILLSSSITYKNIDLGSFAAEKVLRLEPDDSSTHILLSNLYASLGKWDDAAETRKKIRALMLEKDPGLSWIDMQSTVHVFSADDDSHPRIDDCLHELFRLQGNMKTQEKIEIT